MSDEVPELWLIPLKRCYSCSFWNRFTYRTGDEGLVESPCGAANSSNYQKYTKGSDYCSQWMKHVKVANTAANPEAQIPIC